MCVFCDILNNQIINSDYPENLILDSSENFYVKSALGQFVSGYVLINSKEHIPNFSFLNSEVKFLELEVLIAKTKKNIQNILGNTDFIIFEHGSINKFCFNTNCDSKCIDHAHLHIIPTNIDLIKELKNSFSNTQIKSISDIGKHKNKSYIYYSSSINNENYFFQITNFIPSQYMRQLICKNLQIPNYWNWFEYPFRNNIQKFNNQYLRQLSSEKENTAGNSGLHQLLGLR